jgi:hypothetical protein
MERYAHSLRSEGLFPDRTSKRHAPIDAAAAANLILAAAAARNALKAVQAVQSYGPLKPSRQTFGGTLSEFLESTLDCVRTKNKTVSHALKSGTLSIVHRQALPGASWRDGRGSSILFQTAEKGQAPEVAVETHISGATLLELSISLADLPQPKHLAGW